MDQARRKVCPSTELFFPLFQVTNMSRETMCTSYHFTKCFTLLILLQSSIAIPVSYSRKLTLNPDEFLLTYVPSENSLSRDESETISTKLAESWSDVLEDTHSDRVHYLPFRRPTRNTGGADEARYHIRHVGDLPMFRFG
ncbi:hypothetical protein X798_02759 [Onchocerca flexuosa]|uniref:Uncharacterized protein n=1 Tax=Onchocerca flexuosa TaxID=387005 RepID=A0A238BY59_9BILA|nr:hypothetical protein X798_02759 [Onchocerca flexuosa]